jgi:hypothetical protein
MTAPISHALVLPDKNFNDWFRAAEPYSQTFPRVVVVRSPIGADLNRFRDVTAVQTSGVWLRDNPVYHIRRIYPSVVRIDVARANTPDDLRRLFDERIRRQDRYGEQIDSGRHIDDRLALAFPSRHFPARIVRGFDARLDGGRRHEGIDIASAPGENILSATSGTVANVVTTPNIAGYGRYVQVQHTFRGSNFFITYTNFQDIKVQRGQILEPEDVLGTCAGGSFKMVMQAPGRGLRGYYLPDIIDPTPLIYWDGLRLRTTVDGLRLRSRPGVGFTSVGQAYLSDSLESLETHGRTLLKVGVTDEWLRVRAPTGIEGFAAAWYLTATAIDIPEGLNMTGINLDITFEQGRPAPDRLRGVGWTRFTYDISRNTGSLDFDAAELLFRPYIERYATAGQQPIIILNHETYGEGRFNWTQMTPESWAALRRDFAEVCRDVARRYAGDNMIGAYQIWNEQDTAPGTGVAAVPMPPVEYGKLLTDAIRAIRSADPNVKIITGGHVSGVPNGVNYAQAALAAMPGSIRPDGIAFHAYGLGAPNGPEKYRIFGTIGRAVLAFSKIMDAPVWITEWGVLGAPNEPVSDVTQYAVTFIENLKQYYPDRVAAAVWYAWADGMHDGYGLVNRGGQPKQPLYDSFLRA